MEIALQHEAPPLRWDVSGALRVGRSRVLVELVLHAFQDGVLPKLSRNATPPRHGRIFMLSLPTTCVIGRRSKPISTHASSAPRKFANALSATRGTCQTCGSACAHANRGAEAEACYVCRVSATQELLDWRRKRAVRRAALVRRTRLIRPEVPTKSGRVTRRRASVFWSRRFS